MRLAKSTHIILSLFLMLVSSIRLLAQLSQGGIPEGIKHPAPVNDIVEISVPAKTLLQKVYENKRGNHRKSLEFAYMLDADISPSKNGSWSHQGNLNVWTIQIKSSGAKSLSLSIENVNLKEGEKLFIYNKNGVLGAFTKDYNNPGVFNTQYIKGDSLIIEFSTPYKEPGSFSIKKVAHAFLDIFDQSGSCNININCAEGQNWQTEKRAVIRIIINGIGCTGTLLNNAAKDGKALVLTANHCIPSDYEGERSLFYFNYESNLCDTNVGMKNQVIAGAKVLSTNSDNDYSLIELNQHPPVSFMPYYAGWNLESGSNLDGAVCIHHPWADVKKISVEENKVVSGTYSEPGYSFPKNAFWLIEHWEKGTTENGSSGGALFDNKHRVIGSLVGGQADCAIPDSDYFEKLSVSFYAKPKYQTDSLFKILDPINTKLNSLEGFDPYEHYRGLCDTFSNVFPFEIPALIPYEYGTGYYSGHNSDSITSYAEQFNSSKPELLYGAFFNVAKSGSKGNLIVTVSTGNNPLDTLMFEKYVPLSQLKANQKQFVEFYPPIAIEGKYYISYQINYNNSDTFALYQAPPRTDVSTNSAWIFSIGNWIKNSEYTNKKQATSFAIEASYCLQNDTQISSLTATDNLNIYPNPAHSRVVIEFPSGNIRNFKYILYDISGKTVMQQEQNFEKYAILDLTSISPGFYLISVEASGKTYIGKIIKD